MDNKIHFYYTRIRQMLVALTASTLMISLVACTPEQLTVLGQHFHDSSIVAATPVVQRTAPDGSRCPQYYQTALDAGWTHAQWSKIDYIIWRESRCNPTAYNGKRRDNSYGLMQLNMRAHKAWVGPLVNWDFTKLYNPSTNLSVAKELYNRASKMFGCGFQPWKTTKQRHWCN